LQFSQIRFTLDRTFMIAHSHGTAPTRSDETCRAPQDKLIEARAELS
jgi:hypothetical protein